MKPEGVRIVKANGIEFEPELKHLGVDDDGMDRWAAVFEGRLSEGDRMTVAVLPAKTSIGIEVQPRNKEGCSEMNTSIVCPQCGRTSYHPEDVTNRYCGACHQYHDQMSTTPTERGETA